MKYKLLVERSLLIHSIIWYMYMHKSIEVILILKDIHKFYCFDLILSYLWFLKFKIYIVSFSYRSCNSNLVISSVFLTRLLTDDVARYTTDNGRWLIAICHMHDSGDLKIHANKTIIKDSKYDICTDWVKSCKVENMSLDTCCFCFGVSILRFVSGFHILVQSSTVRIHSWKLQTFLN